MNTNEIKQAANLYNGELATVDQNSGRAIAWTITYCKAYSQPISYGPLGGWTHMVAARRSQRGKADYIIHVVADETGEILAHSTPSVFGR